MPVFISPAYGFRDPEFFKLKILAIHETKYALVG
jgi:transposase